MVGAGKHHAAHPVDAGGLVQVVHADDVGLQDRRPGLLGGHATQVHHGVDADHHGLDSSRIGQVGGDNFFARLRCTHVHHIGQAQHLAIGLQATTQRLAQTPSSASEQQTVVRGRHGHGVVQIAVAAHPRVIGGWTFQMALLQSSNGSSVVRQLKV